MERNLTLLVKGLTLEEIKEVLIKVREIEQRHTEDSIIFVWLEGMEDLSKEEALKIMKEIFPKIPISG